MTNSLVGYVGAVPVYLSLVIIGHWSLLVIGHLSLIIFACEDSLGVQALACPGAVQPEGWDPNSAIEKDQPEAQCRQWSLAAARKRDNSQVHDFI